MFHHVTNILAVVHKHKVEPAELGSVFPRRRL